MWGDAMMLERMPSHVGGSCAIWEDALTYGRMPSHLGGCSHIWEDATTPIYKLLFKIN